jgi:hypothetical protein
MHEGSAARHRKKIHLATDTSVGRAPKTNKLTNPTTTAASVRCGQSANNAATIEIGCVLEWRWRPGCARAGARVSRTSFNGDVMAIRDGSFHARTHKFDLRKIHPVPPQTQWLRNCWCGDEIEKWDYFLIKAKKDKLWKIRRQKLLIKI